MRPIKVFISSPGDLFPERDVIKRVLDDLNTSPMFRDHFKLIPYPWEDHAPAWVGPTAQTVVNDRMLMPDAADVMVCMLWLRMGTPTNGLIDPGPGPGTEYISGTYYEFIRAYRAWEETLSAPHLLLYRCTRAKNPVEIDHDQAGKVQAFFKRFEAGGDLKGLVGSFDTPEALSQRVRRDLEEYLTTLMKSIPPGDGAGDVRWEAGVRFEPYTLLKVFGEGGNGEVWRADEALPDGSARQVAIKVLKAEVSRDPVRVQRFRDELSIMARIGKAHKHIVEVYRYGERGEHLYVVMPFMAGGTLRARLAERAGRAFALDDALIWLDQIGTALDYVQKQAAGLVHRDVKPENMLLDDDGETLFLSYFGLAISGADEGRATDPGKPAGTGRYMAPEQWQHQRLSAQTDLYALGILAYELLTGHLPYDHTQGDYVLSKAHCEQDLPADPRLPDEVLRILRKACAKVPAERYPNARSFLGDLRHWESDPATLDPKIEDYLRWLTTEINDRVMGRFVDLEGAAATQRPQPPAPRRRQYNRGDDDDFIAQAGVSVEADHIPARGHAQGGQFVANVHQHLLTLDRAVLIGEPGSGKSWMLQRLAVAYRQAWLAGGPGRRTGRIPVLVLLNEYTGGSFEAQVEAALDTLAPYHAQLRREGRLVILCDALNEMPRSDGQLGKLIAYLKADPQTAPTSIPTKAPLPFVVSCRVADYRDDLGDLRPLEQVLLRDLELPAIRDLITKRLPGADGLALWTKMAQDETRLFRFWEAVKERGEPERFWDVKRGAPDYTDYRDGRVWQAMHQNPRLIPLCRNPYLGHLLTEVYRAERKEGRDLPASRADLFGRFVAKMLEREARTAERREQAFPARAEVEAALGVVAAALQAAERTVMTEADARAAVEAVETALKRGEAGALLRAATDANILTADGEGLKFTHQLLQEYFAAKVLLEALEADEAEGRHDRARAFFGERWWDPGVWRVTTVILGEFLGEGRVGPNRVARWLAPVTPEVALDVILRNAGGLTLTDVEDTTRTALINAAKRHLLDEDHVPPVGRAAAGRVLGYLDADDRPGVGLRKLPSPPRADFLPSPPRADLLPSPPRGRGAGGEGDLLVPDIAWCDRIPPGGFWYGEGQEGTSPPTPLKDRDRREGERSSRGTWTVLRHSFRIARYPVTNAQFRAFSDDPQGYNQRQWWSDDGWAWKQETGHTALDNHPDPRFRLPNHPRVDVSWYEAVAFCNWLTWRLAPEVWARASPIWQREPLTEIKGLIRLPTEQEWERAARGTDGRSYPWGDDFDLNKCNNSAGGEIIAIPSAVGIFPAGASPAEALDMTGNVWEWGLSTYKDSDINISGTRVLRGGAWYSGNTDDFRCVYRNWSNPDNRVGDRGFRLALS